MIVHLYARITALQVVKKSFLHINIAFTFFDNYFIKIPTNYNTPLSHLF